MLAGVVFISSRLNGGILLSVRDSEAIIIIIVIILSGTCVVVVVILVVIEVVS